MEDESGGQDLDSSSEEKPLTFAELADKLCPQYMSIGVSYHEYWYGDYTQLDHYRQAFEMRQKREGELANYNAWLRGAYVYDALCMVSPILRAFPAKNAKPVPYHNEPYGMKQKDGESGEAAQKGTKTEKELQKIRATNASAKFAAFAIQWNKRFESKEGR